MTWNVMYKRKFILIQTKTGKNYCILKEVGARKNHFLF